MRAFLATFLLAVTAQSFAVAATITVPARPPAGAPFIIIPRLQFVNPFATTPSPKPKEEGIRDLSSDITIAPDGLLAVKETVTVHTEGRKILHGITREFSTRYTNRDGHKIHVALAVEGVERDGAKEPYETWSLGTTKGVRIGDADSFLSRGDHTYTILYRADRGVGLFPALDEFLWNVTGNGWDFPIDHAEAIIHLPPSAHIQGHAAYTGRQGVRGTNASAEVRGNRIRFFTTRPLERQEALTVVLDVAKGAFIPPPPLIEAVYLARDHAMTAAAVMGFFALAVYFLATWWTIGRDPTRSVIVPLFAPPRNLSPASLRYIYKLAYDSKCFAAALIEMAVKGFLTIKEEGRTYILNRIPDNKALLTVGERAVARELFANGDSVDLDSSNHELVSGAVRALKASLNREDEGTYVNSNKRWFYGGVAILMMSLIAAMAFAESSGTSAGIMIWIVGWTLALVAVLRLLGDSWRNIATLVAPRLAIVLCLIVVFAMAISIPGETVLDWFSPGIELPPLALAAMFGQACLAATFYHLLKAPTLAGQKIRDEIQGFRMYLETAEKARMQALNSPRVTPEVFEQLLPYAIALDVENAWSRRFESETAQAGQNLNHDYSPNWYAGNAFRGLGDGGFTSRLGDCIGAATASATAGPLSAPSAQSLSVGFSNARSGGSGW